MNSYRIDFTTSDLCSGAETDAIIPDAELLRRLDEERSHVLYEGTTLNRLPLLTRSHSEAGSAYGVVYSALTEEYADAAIAGEVEHHRRLGVPFEWKVYSHDKPPDLVQRLERHGFTIGPRETMMVLDLRTPHWAGDAVSCVMRVSTPTQIELYRQVGFEVFGDSHSSYTTELSKSLASGQQQVTGYLAFDGDRAVSLGRLYLHPESLFGGLYGGGTIKAYRSRGFYRAVVSARARDAALHGARYLVVDALPTSLPILTRMGFVPMAHTWPCEWNPRKDHQQ